MTRDEFFRVLEENNINPNLVSFDDNTRDGYCIRKNYFRWEILVRERGKEYEVLAYPSESDALQKMLEIILRIYAKINN